MPLQMKSNSNPVLRGWKGLFFFFLSVRRKSLLLSRVTVEGSFASLIPGLWKILLCESQRGTGHLTISGFRVHGPRLAEGVRPAGRRGGSARGYGAGNREPERPRRAPRRFKSSHNAALASQFRYTVSRRGRTGEARAGEQGGGGCNPSARPRGAPPRRRSRALSRRPGEGAEPPAARPGPQPGPPPRGTGRGSEPGTDSAAYARPASRTAPGAPLLAQPRLPASPRHRRSAGSGSRRRCRGCPRARTPRHPRPGRPRSPSAGQEVRGEGAPGSWGLPPVRGARPEERRGARRAGLRGRGPALGGRRAPPRPQRPGRPRGAACGGGAVAKLSKY